MYSSPKTLSQYEKNMHSNIQYINIYLQQKNSNSFAYFLLCAQHAFMSACGQLRGLTMNAKWNALVGQESINNRN